MWLYFAIGLTAAALLMVLLFGCFKFLRYFERRRAVGGDVEQSRPLISESEEGPEKNEAAFKTTKEISTQTEVDGRFFEVSVALASCGGTDFGLRRGGREETEIDEERDVQLPEKAIRSHVIQGGHEIDEEAARSKCERGVGFPNGGRWKNTVFQEPEAWDRIFFPGCGHLIVSRHRVDTYLCLIKRDHHIRWAPKWIGRCYAVFSPSGHLFYLTSIATSRVNYTP